MFRFQMIVDGQVIGDTDENIIGSAMATLGELKQLEDPRLAGLSSDPAAVIATLLTDETLHDDAVLSLAESLDRWLVCGYVYQGATTILAQGYRGHDLAGPILVSTVPVADYSTIIDAARTYWLKTRELD
jgi:hypothetical protein